MTDEMFPKSGAFMCGRVQWAVNSDWHMRKKMCMKIVLVLARQPLCTSLPHHPFTLPPYDIQLPLNAHTLKLIMLRHILIVLFLLI